MMSKLIILSLLHFMEAFESTTEGERYKFLLYMLLTISHSILESGTESFLKIHLNFYPPVLFVYNVMKSNLNVRFHDLFGKKFLTLEAKKISEEKNCGITHG